MGLVIDVMGGSGMCVVVDCFVVILEVYWFLKNVY